MIGALCVFNFFWTLFLGYTQTRVLYPSNFAKLSLFFRARTNARPLSTSVIISMPLKGCFIVMTLGESIEASFLQVHCALRFSPRELSTYQQLLQQSSYQDLWISQWLRQSAKALTTLLVVAPSLNMLPQLCLLRPEYCLQYCLSSRKLIHCLHLLHI